MMACCYIDVQACAHPLAQLGQLLPTVVKSCQWFLISVSIWWTSLAPSKHSLHRGLSWEASGNWKACTGQVNGRLIYMNCCCIYIYKPNVKDLNGYLSICKPFKFRFWEDTKLPVLIIKVLKGALSTRCLLEHLFPWTALMASEGESNVPIESGEFHHHVDFE